MNFIFYILFIFCNCQTYYAQVSNNSNENCTIYRNNFGAAISSFTSCAISNSKPIKLCESCVDLYIQVFDSYHNLSVFSDKNGLCIKNYVNVDRLEIMETLYESTFELWNRAKCYECFQMKNGTLTHDLSPETIKFNELYSTTMNCINMTYSNVTDLCRICMDPYSNLSDFYNSISNQNEKIGVCMDIVDLMNGTRSFWSEKCCLFRHHNEYVFIISTGCIFLITILFYALSKSCIDKKFPAIYLQSRFAESLSHVSNS